LRLRPQSDEGLKSLGITQGLAAIVGSYHFIVLANFRGKEAWKITLATLVSNMETL